MSRRPIITLPDPLLRQASAPIERVDDELGRLIDDMLETMYAAPGIGLAAVQVGVPRRLIVVDVAEREEKERAEAAGVGQPKSARKQTTEPASDPIVLINPEIIELGSELAPYEEGCLSIPDVRVDIERPSSVTVRRPFTRRTLLAPTASSTRASEDNWTIPSRVWIMTFSRSSG